MAMWYEKPSFLFVGVTAIKHVVSPLCYRDMLFKLRQSICQPQFVGFCSA